MPIYEYRCGHCKRRVNIFFRTLAAAASETPRCPHCHSTNLTRLVSRFATVKSEEARLDTLADPATLGDLDENDPKSLARFMRKMSQEMGEDLGPEFDEMVGRLEAGESPEEIEKSMPELGAMGGEGETGGVGDDDF